MLMYRCAARLTDKTHIVTIVTKLPTDTQESSFRPRVGIITLVSMYLFLAIYSDLEINVTPSDCLRLFDSLENI